jgi:hypothetical protein
MKRPPYVLIRRRLICGDGLQHAGVRQVDVAREIRARSGRTCRWRGGVLVSIDEVTRYARGRSRGAGN